MNLPGKLNILIITLSDRAFRGEYKDLSGPHVKEILTTYFNDRQQKYNIDLKLIPDDPALLKDTLMDGAVLDISTPPAEGVCEECGKRFSVDFHYAECPSCTSFKVRIVSGTELSIRSMTLG